MSWYNNGPHRTVKLLSYPLLKSLTSNDLSGIASTVASDLTSKDDEIQLTAMKLLYLLPFETSLSIIQSQTKTFSEMIHNSDFNFERIILITDVLLKLYYHNAHANLTADDVVHTLFN